MTNYRKGLPQLSDKFFLTDGGLETSLTHFHKVNLPNYSAFDLLKDEKGINIICNYFKNYIKTAQKAGLGFIMESATWRANPDWAAKLGYSPEELDRANRIAIKMLQYLKKKYQNGNTPIVVSGCIGPRGDGFQADAMMGIDEAEVYHRRQIQVFDNADTDMVTAITMTYTEEAVGIVKAAQNFEIPVVISFKIDAKGNLPSGESLKEAINKVDMLTNMGPVYYMVNCLNSKNLIDIFKPNEHWLSRISAIRTNTSEELNSYQTIDLESPTDLAGKYKQLIKLLPNLRVFGGFSETEHIHIKDISKVCSTLELPSVY